MYHTVIAKILQNIDGYIIKILIYYYKNKLFKLIVCSIKIGLMIKIIILVNYVQD